MGGINLFDIDKLSIPAKAEAMRYGHTAVIGNEEVLSFMDTLSPYLLKGETFSVLPINYIAGTVHMYSVRIIPVIKVRPSHGL
jgi:hypothetical protein